MTTDDLPEGWAFRAATPADATALLALVHACDLATVGFADFDLDEVTDALDGPYDEVAVGPDGAVLGWAYLDNASRGPVDHLQLYTDPLRGAPARRPLLVRALAEVGRRATAFGRPELTARAAAIPNETDLIGVLESAGFAFVKQYARMAIDLPVAPVERPDGVRVRGVLVEDLEVFHRIYDTAFRDTPDYHPVDLAGWRDRFEAKLPWDTSFLATVDGEPAGILLSSPSESTPEGWVRHLAVLPGYRRRGVGRALLGAAFAAYTAKGYPAAGLGVDLANPTDPVTLYLGAGMRAAYRSNLYDLAVPAA